MEATTSTTTEIRPFTLDIGQEQLDELRRRILATRWPTEGAGRRPLAGRAARDDQGTRRLLER